MDFFLHRIKGCSSIRSWYKIFDGSSLSSEELITIRECACHHESIWKTRHKSVHIISMKNGKRAVVKYYREKRFFRYFFRPSLAEREAIGYQIVASLHIPCARVLACGDIRKNLRLRECYFITQMVEHFEQGRDFMQNESKANCRELILEFAKINLKRLALLHHAGFRHGGSQPYNMLWRKKDGEAMECIWIDLATVRKFSFFKHRKMVEHDLNELIGRLQLSSADQAALKDYYISQYKLLS